MSDALLKELSAQSESAQKKPWFGLALAGVTGVAAVALSTIAAPFVAPAFRRICLPYVPASNNQISNIIRAIESTSASGKQPLLPSATVNKTLVDLGSGDGRVVLAASRALPGVTCVGVELNPWLVLYSRLNALKRRQSSNTQFKRQDLFTFSLNSIDIIVIFGVQQMMADLEVKLIAEMPDNGSVIACRFPLPNWTPSCTVGAGIDTVWVYEKPSKNNSTL